MKRLFMRVGLLFPSLLEIFASVFEIALEIGGVKDPAALENGDW